MNCYENTSKYYDAFQSLSVHNDINLYLNFCSKGIDILDVGCGTGRVSLAIAEKIKNCSIDAFDISEDMLEYFKQKKDYFGNILKGKINIFRNTIENYDSDKKYDLIIFPQQVFQVITDDTEKIKSVTKYKNMLKDNGKMIISLFDPNITGVESSNPKDIWGGLVNLEGHEKAICIIEDSIVSAEELTYSFKNKIILFNKYGIKTEEVVDEFKVAYYTKEIARDVFEKAGCNIVQEIISPFRDNRMYNYFDDLFYVIN